MDATAERRARLAVVADVDPGDLGAAARARVLAATLRAHLGDVEVDLLSCRRDQTELRIGRTWFGSWSSGLARPHVAVVACGAVAERVAQDDAPSAAVVSFVALDGSAPDLAARFVAMLDPVALDVRRRTLAALGLLPATGEELDDDRLAALQRALPSTPTDLAVLATCGASIVATDPALLAMIAAPPADVDAALDAVAAAVGATLGTATMRLATHVETDGGATETDALHARVVELAGERDALADRLAHAELRYDELLADRHGAPADR